LEYFKKMQKVLLARFDILSQLQARLILADPCFEMKIRNDLFVCMASSQRRIFQTETQKDLLRLLKRYFLRLLLH